MGKRLLLAIPMVIVPAGNKSIGLVEGMRMFINGHRDERGFALIELMIVALLLSIVLVITTVTIKHRVTKSREAKAIADLRAMKTVLDTYFSEFGEYPGGMSWPVPHIDDVMQENGINWNSDSPDGLKDPWGRAYIYKTPCVPWPGPDPAVPMPNQNKRREAFLLYSRGPDGIQANYDDIYISHNRTPRKDLSRWMSQSEFNSPDPELNFKGSATSYESLSSM